MLQYQPYSEGYALWLGGQRALYPAGVASSGWQQGHGPTHRHTGSRACLCLGRPPSLGDIALQLGGYQAGDLVDAAL